MNINTKYGLLIGFMMILSSCINEEKNLFQESAALRMNNAIENAKQTLISPPNNNGWVMEYFPTNNSEGYTFLMSFNDKTFATIAAKNKYTPVYSTEKSAFDVIGDNGPVLTFNTYNKLFHLFSDPKDPKGGSGLDGIGLEGDYEFIILNASNDLITLKGKKRATNILMYPLAQGQDWEDYFNILDKMDATIFNPKLPITLTLKSNESDNIYYLSEGSSHIFTAKTQSEIDSNNPGESIPFIVTNYGLRFAKPFEIGEKKIQTFQLSNDKSKLICSDKDVQAEITGEELSSVFLKANSALWAFDPTAISESIASLYQRIFNSCISVYQAEDVKIGIGYSGSRRSHELRLVFVRNEGKQTLTGNLSLTAANTAANTVSFQATGAGDNNGLTFSSRIDGYKELAELISQSFTLSSETAINPSNIKFTKVGGADVWFQTNCQ